MQLARSRLAVRKGEETNLGFLGLRWESVLELVHLVTVLRVATETASIRSTRQAMSTTPTECRSDCRAAAYGSSNTTPSHGAERDEQDDCSSFGSAMDANDSGIT